MKEICIPIPYLKDNEIAEVEVTLAGKKIRYDFRVESFPWETENEFGRFPIRWRLSGQDL
jgi:hypothetical protein